MRFTPLSIKKQEFNKAIRGYDKEDVHAFLEKLADELEEIQRENEEMKKQLDVANSQLSEFRRIEKNLQETLLKAQESSAKAIESTKKQTTLMIKEAEIKSSQLIEKAKEQADDVRNSIIKLREERDFIIAKLRAIVSTQSQLLEMKIERADKEKIPEKKIEHQTKVDINIDEMVNKLL